MSMALTRVDKKLIKIEPKPEASNESKPDVGKGPVCAVCGDEASGMHYRAMTCEGCKTFFRRNAAKRQKLKCDLDEGKCVMNAYLRRHCAFCRMKKCIAVGMQVDRVWNKERVKTRKPITKKPKPKKTELPTPKDISSSTSIGHKAVEIPAEIQKLMDIVEKAYTKSHALPKQNVYKLPTPISQMVVPDDEDKASKESDSKEQESSKSENVKENEDSKSHSHDDNANSSYTDDKNTVCESNTQISVNKSEEFTSIVNEPKTVVSPSKTEQFILPVTPPPSSCDPNESRNRLSSSSSPSSVCTMGSGADATGSGGSVDATMTSYIMQMSLIGLRAMIVFCKELPIFPELSWESQAALIKGAFVEFVFIGSVFRFNDSKRLVESYFNPGHVYTRDMCNKAGMGNVFDEIAHLADKLLPLQLTTSEFSVLYALCIFSPDRPGLGDESKKIVESAQEQLAEGLRCKLEQRGLAVNFPKVIMVLADLRNVTDTYKNDIMQVELHSNVITPLLAEMFDINCA
ncbi:vitamin D3 receptor-like [Amphiura filiformis]|uniref:vitamin D3 receptor-like n=1 Tax=Amphiura filiformis TaxID=82378 RepID=UPI003B215A31